MSFLRNVVIFLIYITSSCYALQCTTNCSIFATGNSVSDMLESCNITTSAKYCDFQLSVYYPYVYTTISLSATSSKSPLGTNYYAGVYLSKDGSISFSYSINKQCKNKDDCARELGTETLADIIDRLSFDYQAISGELFPLLWSNLSTADSDVLCFDSKENVRQCSIPTKFGICQATDLFSPKKTTRRICEHDTSKGSHGISMFEMNNYASFAVTCNRSLCNGPMTVQAVKEILFKYNITKTIDGRLNHGLRLSFSFTFLMFIILLLLFV